MYHILTQPASSGSTCAMSSSTAGDKSCSDSACACRRVLQVRVGRLGFDDLALESHALGRAMRMALATDRTLLIETSWRSNYAPAQPSLRHSRNDSSPWVCIWEHTNACPFHSSAPCKDEQHRPDIMNDFSAAYNTRFYGPSLRQQLLVGSFGKSWLMFDRYSPEDAAKYGAGGSGLGNDSIPAREPVPLSLVGKAVRYLLGACTDTGLPLAPCAMAGA